MYMMSSEFEAQRRFKSVGLLGSVSSLTKGNAVTYRLTLLKAMKTALLCIVGESFHTSGSFSVVFVPFGQH